jgi:hypothetical protein
VNADAAALPNCPDTRDIALLQGFTLYGDADGGPILSQPVQIEAPSGLFLLYQAVTGSADMLDINLSPAGASELGKLLPTGGSNTFYIRLEGADAPQFCTLAAGGVVRINKLQTTGADAGINLSWSGACDKTATPAGMAGQAVSGCYNAVLPGDGGL